MDIIIKEINDIKQLEGIMSSTSSSMLYTCKMCAVDNDMIYVNLSQDFVPDSEIKIKYKASDIEDLVKMLRHFGFEVVYKPVEPIVINNFDELIILKDILSKKLRKRLYISDKSDSIKLYYDEGDIVLNEVMVEQYGYKIKF